MAEMYRKIGNEARRLLSAIEAIARSPQVHNFVVGYTSQSARKRGQQYSSECFDHLVILADKMNSDEALNLESDLDQALKEADKRSIIWKKWNGEKRSASYRRSAGGGSKNPEEPIHSVYIAWCIAAD